MPREVQEAAIIEDLLFVLMGIEGQYITYAAGYDPEDVACQLRGATYTVDSSLGESTMGSQLGARGERLTLKPSLPLPSPRCIVEGPGATDPPTSDMLLRDLYFR